MSISVIQYPSFSLSRQPIWYRFMSNNYRLTAGSISEYDLVIPSGLTAGQSFDLIFNQKRYTFVCDTLPNGEGYEFRPYVNSTGFNNMINVDFTGNYYINKHFTLTGTYATGTVRFTSREVGAMFNLSLENAAAGITLTQVTAGADATFRPNFKAWIDLHHQINHAAAAAENLVAQLDADAHQDSITGSLAADEFVFDFELQNILHSLLSAYVPDATETLIKAASSIITGFWIRYGEMFGTSPIVNKNATHAATTDAYPQVLLGGWQLDDDYDALNTAILGTAFLNQQPSTKVISKSNPEYLFKYLTAAATDLQLKYKIYYTDGTTSTGLAGTALASSLAKNVYCFPAGWDILNLGAVQPTKDAVKYELFVTNSASAVLSLTQTYILDNRYYEESDVFIFLGAAGAMETVWCHGYKKTALQSTSDTYQLAKMPWYTKGNQLLKHTNSQQSTITTYYTGFKSLEYINWLKDLANSDTVMILDSGTWASVRLDKKSITDIPTNLDNLYAISFDIERLEKL